MPKKWNSSSSSDDDSGDEISPSSGWNNSNNLPSVQTSSSDSDSDEGKVGTGGNQFSFNNSNNLMKRSSFKAYPDESPRKKSKKDSYYMEREASLIEQSFQNDNEKYSGDEAYLHKSDHSKSKAKQNASGIHFRGEGSSLDRPLEIDNKGRSMLERMGYRSGEGLGKNKQGRVDPVELSKQKGRLGLGAAAPDLQSAAEFWKPEMEITDIMEEVTWLECQANSSIPLSKLRSWKTVGKKDLNIAEMTDFCDSEILERVLSLKTVFDNLGEKDLFEARKRSNPFETIAGGIFLNRAAMKMANMDARFDFMFTDPKDENDESMIRKDGLLYFADVCAGPGGFSEYVLWRKKWYSKGFGFTLKGDNDFKLSDFYAGPCETFEPYYGVKGNGDVMDPENIESFTQFVMNATDHTGVHFMMADGGFSVKNQENIQELLSKQLYLCQFLVALSIVRTGGHFVCKLFDLFSPFSAGLVYLMYNCFEKISIFKPNTSRPANSERYIVCKWKRNDTDDIRQYMFELNESLCELSSSPETDITHCVPMSKLKSDSIFYDYLVESNNRLGERQIINLAKICAFSHDKNLSELPKQSKIRSDCLRSWKVPEQMRQADRATPDDVVNKILSHSHPCKGLFSSRHQSVKLNPENLESSFKSVHDWKYVVLGCENDLHFYLGLGRSRIFRWSSYKNRWEVCDNVSHIELSPGTIVYGELVQEFKGERGSQKKSQVLHIFDAVALGYEDVSEKLYSERLKSCLLYAEALKKFNTGTTSIRVIRGSNLENIRDVFRSLTIRYTKLNKEQLVVEEDDCFYPPKGILFFRTTNKPWTIAQSRRGGYLYYFNLSNGVSKFEQDMPFEAIANIRHSIEGQRIWLWEDGVGIHQEQPRKGIIHMDHIMEFVTKKTQPK